MGPDASISRRKEGTYTPWNAASILDAGNTPADQFGISFENIHTAHRRVFSGLGKINGRQNDYSN